jgi:ABC-2 type transport system ATP-binding protein
VAAISTKSLARVFRPRRTADGAPIVALAALSLEIGAGEVHGLLGPNGAGKTTLMRLLSTILLPTSGQAAVHGYDVVSQTHEVRRIVSVVFGGERGFYPRLTGRQNLNYWAALFRLRGREGRQRVEYLLDRFDLQDRADSRVETYSTGMRQRLHLARGLVSSPRVLLLDEPTNGLDPVAAGQLRLLIRETAADGRTVLMATHDMAEAESVCDRVSLINHGQLIATEHPRTLALSVLGGERVEVDGADEHLLATLRALPDVTSVVAAGPDTSRIKVSRPQAIGVVLQHLINAGATSARAVPPSLEEVYLTLVGKDAAPICANQPQALGQATSAQGRHHGRRP